MSTTNRFFWYELMTSDTKAAGKFYSDVVGWTTQEIPGGDTPYTTFNIGEVGMAGMLNIGGHTGWIGYIVVDDVDAHIEKMVAAGAKLVDVDILGHIFEQWAGTRTSVDLYQVVGRDGRVAEVESVRIKIPEGTTINVCPDASLGQGTRPNPGTGRFSFASWNGWYSYHALQAQVRKTMSHGFQIQGNYTWAKNIDIGSGAEAGSSRCASKGCFGSPVSGS